ncbi:hypothetical protein B5M09_012374 [Aphanomyces astaci]|uniref:Uncharacterized protein n=1 Tax=Aphanomyces astaci TaxID=112090 RepID=A0A3R7Y480_APHAT|nr:hypothetical protein B5M09_012374 [Aphanomyces astaci]
MQEFIALDFPGTQLSNQMISRYLLRMLYSAKEVRIEPSTCNSDENKAKRKEFAAALVKYQRNGDFIVDFNSYLESRMRLLEEAATEFLPRITQYLVIREAMFCQRNIEKALNLENMQYGK